MVGGWGVGGGGRFLHVQEFNEKYIRVQKLQFKITWDVVMLL